VHDYCLGLLVPIARKSVEPMAAVTAPAGVAAKHPSLKRAFLGWLRGEPRHCSMAMVSTLEEEDAKRPNRERENWSTGAPASSTG
jgi:hypothetical protein